MWVMSPTVKANEVSFWNIVGEHEERRLRVITDSINCILGVICSAARNWGLQQGKSQQQLCWIQWRSLFCLQNSLSLFSFWYSGSITPVEVWVLMCAKVWCSSTQCVPAQLCFSAPQRCVITPRFISFVCMWKFVSDVHIFACPNMHVYCAASYSGYFVSDCMAADMSLKPYAVCQCKLVSWHSVNMTNS